MEDSFVKLAFSEELQRGSLGFLWVPPWGSLGLLGAPWCSSGLLGAPRGSSRLLGAPC